MKVVVYHGSYGCDTGCCGHWIRIGEEERFSFDHPNRYYHLPPERRREGILAFAKKAIEEEWGLSHTGHLADLDWENSIILDFMEEDALDFPH